MKKIIYGIILRIIVWSFDKMYDLIDSDKDGKISKEELLLASKRIDVNIKKIKTMIKKK